MIIKIPKSGENILLLMRKIGYGPDRNSNPKEPSFSRPLAGRPYPKFHIYVEEQSDKFLLKLHLDQKQPSYSGTAAHAGEYDGPTVEAEAARIKSTLL